MRTPLIGSAVPWLIVGTSDAEVLALNASLLEIKALWVKKPTRIYSMMIVIVPRSINVTELQKIALLGSAQILWKVLSIR